MSFAFLAAGSSILGILRLFSGGINVVTITSTVLRHIMGEDHALLPLSHKLSSRSLSFPLPGS